MGKSKKSRFAPSKAYKLEDVNVKHTTTWVALNDDSRCRKYRAEFLGLFGGEFIEDRKYVKWQPIQIIPKYNPPLRLITMLDKNNNIIEIDNFAAFCRDNGLNRVAMYDVLRGSRRSFKGYTSPNTYVPKASKPVSPGSDELPDITTEL